MKWYIGNIGDAVNLCKKQNSIFVVYVEEKTDATKNLSTLIDTSAIRQKLETNTFVAIKILSESESYFQFAEIYKLVPVPSIFFIGQNGEPLDIIAETTITETELLDKIKAVIEKSGIKESTTTTTSTTNEPSTAASSSANFINQEASSSSSSSSTQPSTNPAEIDKLERAKKLIEQKRKEKDANDALLAKERELQRRRAGQDLKAFKEKQDEIDIKLLKEERDRDRLEAQVARKRILDQIAHDRAENALKFRPIPTTTKDSQPNVSESNLSNSENVSNMARIQFKKPDGSIELYTFNNTDTFRVVRAYVENTVLAGTVIRDFSLAMSFPRKRFTAEDDDKTMVELNLAPTAVILILTSEKVNSASGAINHIHPFDLFKNVFWTVFTPVLSVLNYLKTFIFTRIGGGNGGGVGGGGGGGVSTGAGSANNSGTTGGRSNLVGDEKRNEDRISDNDAAKRRNLRIFQNDPSTSAGPSSGSIPSTSGVGSSSSTAYKRVGTSNIHRLHEKEDSDDDNNTWNGNSTQQQ